MEIVKSNFDYRNDDVDSFSQLSVKDLETKLEKMPVIQLRLDAGSSKG
jgi:hypothetical protein